jgi:hypothetical protein
LSLFSEIPSLIDFTSLLSPLSLVQCRRLRSAEAKINALADQISHVSADSTIADAMASESELRRSLADAQLRLARYEKILGDTAGGMGDGEGGGDVQKMAKRLEDKEEELRVVELKLKENEMVRFPLPLRPTYKSGVCRESGGADLPFGPSGLVGNGRSVRRGRTLIESVGRCLRSG